MQLLKRLAPAGTREHLLLFVEYMGCSVTVYATGKCRWTLVVVGIFFILYFVCDEIRHYRGEKNTVWRTYFYGTLGMFLFCMLNGISSWNDFFNILMSSCICITLYIEYDEKINCYKFKRFESLSQDKKINTEDCVAIRQNKSNLTAVFAGVRDFFTVAMLCLLLFVAGFLPFFILSFF